MEKTSKTLEKNGTEREESNPFKDYAEDNSVGGLSNVLTGDSKSDESCG